MPGEHLLDKLTSKDINKSKINEENLRRLKVLFPREDIDTLARYLVARNNHVDGAQKQLIRGLDWKKKVWPVLKSSCIREINKGKLYMHGTDREGRPLLIITSRLHNPFESDPQEMVRLTLWFTEQARPLMILPS